MEFILMRWKEEAERKGKRHYRKEEGKNKRTSQAERKMERKPEQQ